ncbi:uncharacterized protein LOC103706148 [Phoenix dactylifera]|uniref:Uncharacterized protein LOC103706148 n=1 Tax=Phoenix dactylifera TaxID=42345 RepID=A0A8B7BZ29_PHODC|nr:uncharacterized protein LOC103706148 [Phoenix dactylifera]
MMGDGVKQILAKPIQLADQVTKLAGDAHTSRQECLELKAKTEKLAALLRQAARAELYERPATRIMQDTELVLGKALGLACKCRAHGLMRRVFTIIPATAFAKMSTQLDNSIADVSWLLRISTAGADDDQFLGLPPIAQNEPILFLIWDHISNLHTGSVDVRSDSAAALASLARDNLHYAKLIIEEDGVGALLRLVKEGNVDGQENAARALGFLGRDWESVDRMLNAGVCTVLTKLLKDGGPMRAQAAAAWAVAELAGNHFACQELFAQNNVIRLLVGHLAFETVQEHSKYSIIPASKAMSIHSVVVATTANKPGFDDDRSSSSSGGQFRHHPNALSQIHSVIESTMASAKSSKAAAAAATATNGAVPPSKPILSSGFGTKGRDSEDPATKAEMKAMAAKALWQLAKNNLAICKSITESRALLCFAVLLEKGSGEVRYNSTMALMEIARVAEDNPDLRRSAFKPTSPAAKAVVDQLLRIVDKGVLDELLIPSITALGCLSRTFRATETRIIGPLVRLLDEREAIVSRESVLALTKFASTDNFLRVEHSKAIIEAGGAKHLVQLVYLGEQLQIEALILLCHIALNVPDSEDLAQAGVPAVLAWASKQGHMVQDFRVDSLLPTAKAKMELYQSRGSR